MAHRGNRAACPENTLASFRRAIADGADVLETDLWLSRDGAFVCIHDATLERTTDTIGNPLPGASTHPPSHDGSGSSDAEPHTQLTIEDA